MSRLTEELKYLVQNNDYLTVNSIAELFEVSTRTARDDIKKIDEYLRNNDINFINNKKFGIKVENENQKEKLNDLLKMSNTNEPFLKTNRKHIILQNLLIDKGDCTIKDLAYYTKSSRSTILKDLIECESWLNKRNVSVVKNPYYGMRVSYDENDYRVAIVEELVTYRKTTDYYSLLDVAINAHKFKEESSETNKLLYYYTKDLRLTKIREFITETERQENYKFSDESFVNIFLYMCISIKRIHNNHLITNNIFENADGFIEEELEKSIKNIEARLPEVTSAVFTKNEILHLLCYMLSQNKTYAKSANAKKINENHLVKKFLKRVGGYLGVNLLDDKNLYDGLMLHIIPTIHRVIYDLPFENPLKEQIKDKYSDIFNACKKASEVFEDVLKGQLNDDELSLLAMHVGASIEKIKNKNLEANFKKAILVCSSGVGTTNMLCARLNSVFPSLVISNIYSINELKEAEIENADLILTTIPISVKTKKPIICVTPLLNDEDIRKIENCLYITTVSEKLIDRRDDICAQIVKLIEEEYSEIDSEKIYEKLSNYFKKTLMDTNEIDISDFINEHNVVLQHEKVEWRKAIEAAGIILLKNGCIKGKYIDDMVQAVEEFGPYIILADGIALAHGKAGKHVVKTGFSFVTFKQGIDFGEKYAPVKIIIGLAADGSGNHLNVLNYLSDFIVKDGNVERWVKFSNTEEFIEYVLK